MLYCQCSYFDYWKWHWLRACGYLKIRKCIWLKSLQRWYFAMCVDSIKINSLKPGNPTILLWFASDLATFNNVAGDTAMSKASVSHQATACWLVWLALDSTIAAHSLREIVRRPATHVSIVRVRVRENLIPAAVVNLRVRRAAILAQINILFLIERSIWICNP